MIRVRQHDDGRALDAGFEGFHAGGAGLQGARFQGRGFGRFVLEIRRRLKRQREDGQDRSPRNPVYFCSPAMIAVVGEGTLGWEDESA